MVGLGYAMVALSTAVQVDKPGRGLVLAAACMLQADMESVVVYLYALPRQVSWKTPSRWSVDIGLVVVEVVDVMWKGEVHGETGVG